MMTWDKQDRKISFAPASRNDLFVDHKTGRPILNHLGRTTHSHTVLLKLMLRIPDLLQIRVSRFH